MAIREALGPRPDGRLYSRVTRRATALLKHIAPGREFDLIEVAREVHDQGTPEFLRADGQSLVPIRAERIRDYLSYLHDLGLVVQTERKFTLKRRLRKPNTDAEWAQFLSDVAREHLAAAINTRPAELPAQLERHRKSLHKKARVPTVAALLSDVGLEGARNIEVFRWSLYLYADGDACPIEIRQYPHIGPRS